MFTENQVRQFYVLSGTSDDVLTPNQNGKTPADLVNAGAMELLTKGDEAYFLYKGPSDDGLQRSDRINKCNVVDVRLTDAADLKHIKNRKELTLAASLVSSSNLTVTGDYVVNVEIKNYIALGDDSTKIKFGVAHGAAGTSASDLYKKIAINLAKNFSREPAPMLKIMLKNASTPVEVKPSDTLTTLLSTTATGIIFEEVEQPWRRGVAKQEFVNFDIIPSTVYSSGEDVIWGVVNDAKSASYYIPNSKHVADMEGFFHKERGDIYGEVDYPNNIDTVYQVNPASADGYSFADIHFYFEGNSHNVGKSEKTLTIVGTKTLIKKLIGSPYVPADDPDPAVPATGLYAFLEGTGVTIKKSASWD